MCMDPQDVLFCVSGFLSRHCDQSLRPCLVSAVCSLCCWVALQRVNTPVCVPSLVKRVGLFPAISHYERYICVQLCLCESPSSLLPFLPPSSSLSLPPFFSLPLRPQPPWGVGLYLTFVTWCQESQTLSHVTWGSGYPHCPGGHCMWNTSPRGCGWEPWKHVPGMFWLGRTDMQTHRGASLEEQRCDVEHLGLWKRSLGLGPCLYLSDLSGLFSECSGFAVQAFPEEDKSIHTALCCWGLW